MENKAGNRREETIVTRLRIGHNKLNSTLHIMGKHPTGFCDQCQIPETVEHVLINCSKYGLQRVDMIKDMGKIGLTGRGVKSIMDCSRSEQGVKYLIRFLTKTGLMTRI